jgi:hypothetical protein
VTKKALLSEINIVVLIDSWSMCLSSMCLWSKQASKQRNLSVGEAIPDRAKQLSTVSSYHH